MRFVRSLAFIAVVVAFVSSAALAQNRGEGRIYGTVKDASGQPVEGAVVKAVKEGQTAPLTAKTNKKGEWSIGGMAGGTWNVDVSKDGFETKSVSVPVSEMERAPAMNITLAKKAADPNAEIQAEVKKGDALFDQKQYVESRKVYEDLITKYPDAWQLELRIARSLEAEGKKEEALTHMQAALAKDPNNVEIKLYIAGMMMDLKKDDEARKLLDTIDMSKVSDPVLFLNAGISLINQGKAADAKAIFDKVIEHFPNAPEGYYYRGRANLAMNSFPEAKADLQKFVSMAKPDDPAVAEAKKILEQLK
jgi:tetratricopeptide (TPR) repeat protein